MRNRLAGVSTTRLLARSNEGDREAGGEAFSRIYAELRRIAVGYLRLERPGHTLQPTAVVHEAFVRLDGGAKVDWESRAQFLGIAARVMRQVLVDHGRRRGRAKRGKGWCRASGIEIGDPADRRHLTLHDVVDLDGALTRLGRWDTRKVRIVEARFFAGMTVPEIATYVGVSTATVHRELRRAKAWLFRDLSSL